MFKKKTYDFQRGWRFGHRFLAAPSQSPTEISNNKALWEGVHSYAAISVELLLDRMLVSPDKRQAGKTNLEPASQEGSGQVLSLSCPYINYFGRSKAVCSQARGQKESLGLICHLLQLINSIQNCSAPGRGQAESPSGFSLVLQLGPTGLLPQAYCSLPTLMLMYSSASHN